MFGRIANNLLLDKPTFIPLPGPVVSVSVGENHAAVVTALEENIPGLLKIELQCNYCWVKEATHFTEEGRAYCGKACFERDWNK